MLLAAVRVEQNAIGHVEELYSCSCFVNEKDEAVYVLRFSGSATATVSAPLEGAELEQRSEKIRALTMEMMADSAPVARELFDSLIIDKTRDDAHLRLSYLRLWQAVEDARRHLGQSGLLNEQTAIGGKRSPAELKEYRNQIAHWHTGRVDGSFLSDLQYTAMELLRRKYGEAPEQ